MSLHEWVYIHTTRMQSFPPHWQLSLSNCFLNGGKQNNRSLWYTLIRLTRVCFHFSVSTWTAETWDETRLDFEEAGLWNQLIWCLCVLSKSVYCTVKTHWGNYVGDRCQRFFCIRLWSHGTPSASISISLFNPTVIELWPCRTLLSPSGQLRGFTTLTSQSCLPKNHFSTSAHT